MSHASMNNQPPASDASAPPGRNRSLVIGAAVALVALAVVAVLAVTQLPQFAGDPTAEPTASPAASPTSSPEPSGSASDEATPSPSAESGELPTGPADSVMSFTTRCDVVPPVVSPATTVLEDGRVVWRAEDGTYFVRQLTPEGLDSFREQVRSTGLFETSADYELERRPGTPEPPGHGVCLWSFVWEDDGATGVEVNAVQWLGDEEEAMYYQPSPERETLDALAQQLMDPTTWYGDDGWVQSEAVAFEPEEYRVLVAVTIPQAATPGAPDLDQVSWPFDETPTEVGVDYGSADPPARCALASADAIEALASELAAAGLEQFDEPPFSGVGATLPWQAESMAVDISFWPMLPDGRPECVPDDE